MFIFSERFWYWLFVRSVKSIIYCRILFIFFSLSVQFVWLQVQFNAKLYTYRDNNLVEYLYDIYIM